MAYKAASIQELLQIMKKVQGDKSLTAFASELGVSKQYLSNVYNGHKQPSERLLANFGFTRTTGYVPVAVAATRGKKRI